MKMAEGLHEEEAIEQGVGLVQPIAGFEHHVAIHAHDTPARRRQRLQREVHQSLFLPQHIPAAQLDEDVRIAVKGRVPVEFYGRMGGVVPFTEELLREIERVASSKLSVESNPREEWFERMVGMR